MSMLYLLATLLWTFPFSKSATTGRINALAACVGSLDIREPFAVPHLRPAIYLACQKAKILHGVDFQDPDLKDIHYGAPMVDPPCNPINESHCPPPRNRTSLCGAHQTSESLAQFYTMMTENLPLKLLLGPSCDIDMRFMAQAAMARNISIFTAGAPDWQHVGLSPLLNRFGYSTNDLVTPIVSFLVANNWNNISLIWYQRDPSNPDDARNFTHESALKGTPRPAARLLRVSVLQTKHWRKLTQLCTKQW